MNKLLARLSTPRASFSAIKAISYAQLNLSKIDTILTLPPHKAHLADLIQNKLGQICSDLSESRREFENMQNKVGGLYDFIRSDILNEKDDELGPSFLERAHYYFQKEGKKVRPLMVYMLAHNYANSIK